MNLTKVSFSMITSAAFNVVDYGADPTGATDCTATIQAAVDAADAAGGGVVYFPTGTYLLVGQYTPITNNSRLTDGVTLKSNISFVGDGNQSIIKLADNCCYAFTGRFRQNVTALTNLYNIQFKNLSFQMPTRPASFFAEQLTLFIDSCENCLIENCEFIGWSGDAIMLGGPLAADTGSFKSSIVKNITVQNCLFDGIDKDNRNCISVFTGEFIEIANNTFKNSSRNDMPGAIDFEPELASCVIRHISVHDNQFYNIGGGVAVIGLALLTNLTEKAEDIIISNNNIANCTASDAFAVTGRSSANPYIVAANSPYNISFIGNQVDCNLTMRPFGLRGCTGVTIEGNTFLNGNGPCLLGFPINTVAAPLSNISIVSNVFRGCRVVTANPYDGIFYLIGTVGGFTLSKNDFISCGRWSNSTTPATMQIIQIDSDEGEHLSYADISNNFVSSNGLAYSQTSPVFYATTLVYPQTVTLRDNKYIGAYEDGNADSMYTLGTTSFTNGSASFYNLASAPSNPKEGDIYYDSTLHKPYVWNGSSWNALF